MSLSSSPKHIRCTCVDNLIILDIIGPDAHYWSPQLSFRVEQDEENPVQSIVSGLYGPRPAVWTMFVFIYFAIGIIGLFISSYGISQWMLGNYSNYLLGFPVALLFMLTAYAVGKFGENLGQNQIEMLRILLIKALNLNE